ncbi:siphovirus Gp157 family protein [Brucella intermedia]|uniref:siphovirus Gp157 family protein n=1 Tax=Brucella intermedia TaxID=94625 RepID=UPI00209AFE45|nr:siphovirus Gp157 family protein [Brucella intermedia]MCO7736418.1 siphovirus Gp157 family protein [Brucella intermedia]WLF99091.1 siphovirus Gp157 family protein [Brucella intermedia]
MMGKYVSIDAINVANEISLLVEMYPELQDDEDLRSDMLEGNTSLHDVLSRIVAIERDANSMLLAIGERAKELAARKDRYARRKDAMRALLLRLLKAADLTKVSLTEATVSIGKGRAGVEIVDETLLPARFLKVVKSPDKTLIKEALDAGKTVKGAVLREGQPTLTVRAA